MSESERQRALRDQREANPTPIRLTERDIQIIRAVYECRVLTTQQLQDLFFPSLHQAYARLAALYHHAYLDRKFVGAYIDKMNTPIMYVLDKRGADLLQAELGLEVNWSSEYKQVGVQFLEHTLAINTCRVAVAKACEETPGFRLLKWLSEADLKADYDRVTIRSTAGKNVSVSLIPDSYFVLDTPRGMAHFFLELDRGTMTTKRFKSKIYAYQAYYQTGAYEKRYATKSLRVLTVTPSQVRATHLRVATEDAGGKQRFWFTTLEQIAPATILMIPIWEVATKTEKQPLVELAP